MKFYSEEKVNELRKINKNRKVFMIVFAVVTVFVLIISMFFLNDNTVKIIKLINCTLISLSLCIIFYNLVNFIYINKRIIEHIEYVMVSNYEEISGEVIEIKEEKTITRDVVVKQLLVKNNDKEIYINYNLMCNQIEIKLHDKIKVDVANSFIITEGENQ